MKTKQIAYTALLCALSVIILYLPSMIPTARIAVIAIAGILPSILVIKYGISAGFVLYSIVSVLSLLILPNKGITLLYIVLFGHYPMIKSLIERVDRLWVEWILKLVFFNVLTTALLLLAPGLLKGFVVFNTPLSVKLLIPIIYVAGNIVFVIFDIGFTGLIAVFINRLVKWM
ncbi:MAG: hypothetical protein ACOX1Q_06305 [Eubacteriales bacterium]|jgi:hypothetical protein